MAPSRGGNPAVSGTRNLQDNLSDLKAQVRWVHATRPCGLRRQRGALRLSWPPIAHRNASSLLVGGLPRRWTLPVLFGSVHSFVLLKCQSPGIKQAANALGAMASLLPGLP